MILKLLLALKDMKLKTYLKQVKNVEKKTKQTSAKKLNIAQPKSRASIIVQPRDRASLIAQQGLGLAYCSAQT